MWRAMIHLDLYAGPRPAEFATLRLENVDWENAMIRGWEQPEKHGATRDVAIPEQWVILGDGRQGPALEWYVKNVRSEVRDDMSPKAPVFVTFAGKAYTPRSLRNLISDGIHDCLGHPQHQRSRASARVREVAVHPRLERGRHAVLIDDDKDVVEASYIDVNHVKTKGRKRHRSAERYPMVDWIRPMGQEETEVKTVRRTTTRERVEIRRDPS